MRGLWGAYARFASSSRKADIQSNKALFCRRNTILHLAYQPPAGNLLSGWCYGNLSLSLAGEVAIQRVEIPYKLAEIYGGTESDCRWFGMVKPARSDHSAKRLSSNHAISLAIQGRQKCGNLAVADLESISQHAWSEIAERIDWATRYITKNAQKAQQSKDKQNITLDGILHGLNS